MIRSRAGEESSRGVSARARRATRQLPPPPPARAPPAAAAHSPSPSIRRLSYGLDARYIDPAKVALKVIAGLYDGITTRELDTLAAETCAWIEG